MECSPHGTERKARCRRTPVECRRRRACPPPGSRFPHPRGCGKRAPSTPEWGSVFKLTGLLLVASTFHARVGFRGHRPIFALRLPLHARARIGVAVCHSMPLISPPSRPCEDRRAPIRPLRTPVWNTPREACRGDTYRRDAPRRQNQGRRPAPEPCCPPRYPAQARPRGMPRQRPAGFGTRPGKGPQAPALGGKSMRAAFKGIPGINGRGTPAPFAPGTMRVAEEFDGRGTPAPCGGTPDRGRPAYGGRLPYQTVRNRRSGLKRCGSGQPGIRQPDGRVSRRDKPIRHRRRATRFGKTRRCAGRPSRRGAAPATQSKARRTRPAGHGPEARRKAGGAASLIVWKRPAR